MNRIWTRNYLFSFQPMLQNCLEMEHLSSRCVYNKEFRNMPPEEHLNMFNAYLLNDSMMLRSLVRASSSAGSDVNRLFLGRNPITVVTLVLFILINSSCSSIISWFKCFQSSVITVFTWGLCVQVALTRKIQEESLKSYYIRDWYLPECLSAPQSYRTKKCLL